MPVARMLASLLAAAMLLAGCYASHDRSGEGGLVDLRDGGADDASLDAATRPEAGLADAASPMDAAIPLDGSSPIDAALRDAALPMDAATPRDAGARDSGARDAGARDAARPDAARPDAAGPDAGPPSRALEFLPDDFLFVPHRPGLSALPPFTFELWMRARGPGLVTRKGNDGGQQHLVVRIEGEGEAAEIVTGWTTDTLTRHEVRAPFGAHVGRWTHVAVVVSAADASGSLTLTLFVDFARCVTATLPDDIGGAFNTQPLLMGRFDGDLDEIRLWAVARGESALIADGRRRIPGSTAGLAAYWPLEEAGQIALDRAMRGNDAILGSLTTRDDADPRWITDGPIP